jgi:hypothetical protein
MHDFVQRDFRRTRLPGCLLNDELDRFDSALVGGVITIPDADQMVAVFAQQLFGARFPRLEFFPGFHRPLQS